MVKDPIFETAHCFVSQRGELLPRWREAFPSALALKLDHPGRAPATVQLAWVRLTKQATPGETLAAVRRRLGDIAIIALADEPADDEALACFAAGVRGYCNTHASAELLRRVAEVAAQGGLWIGESLMQRLLRGTTRIPLPAPPGTLTDWSALLSERERQVATAIAEGATNKEIARRLDITERTVKAHASAIFEKLHVRDRLQLSLLVHRRPVGISPTTS